MTGAIFIAERRCHAAPAAHYCFLEKMLILHMMISLTAFNGPTPPQAPLRNASHIFGEFSYLPVPRVTPSRSASDISFYLVSSIKYCQNFIGHCCRVMHSADAVFLPLCRRTASAKLMHHIFSKALHAKHCQKVTTTSLFACAIATGDDDFCMPRSA